MLATRPLVAVLLPALLAAGALWAPAAAPAAVARLDIRIDRAIHETRKRPARMVLRARRGGYRGWIGIESRGGSSRYFPKRSFSLETRTRGEENRDAGLLGLPRENDWILDGAYADATLMRNSLAYRAARHLGRWAPRTRFVELRLNGRYRGVYILTERPKLDGARVDVDRKGVSGGYLLELTDQGDSDVHGPVTGRPYLHHDPESEDLSREERAWIAGYVAEAERALHAPAGGWRAHLDEAAAVDYLLLQELFKNQDAFHRSTFLAKGTGGPLTLGPVWDFDRAMGDRRYVLGPEPYGWITPGRPLAAGLLADARFAAAVRARWQAVGERLLAQLSDAIDAYAHTLRGAHIREARRWSRVGRPDHRAEVRRLREWLQARAAWMDANIHTLGA